MAAVKPRTDAPARPPQSQEAPPAPPPPPPPRDKGGSGAKRSIIAGVVVLAVLLAGTAVAVAAPRLLGAGEHSFQIRFDSADGLVAGSDVLAAGSKIGSVNDIQPTGDNHALVTVGIGDDHWPLHDGVSAEIRPKSLLGEKYISIHDGTRKAGWNPNGPLVTNTQAVPVELDQFLSSLDSNTRSAARILLNDLGAGVGGRGPDLNAAIAAGKQDLDHLATFGTTLNNRDPDLDRILVGLDGLMAKLTQEDQLKTITQLTINSQQTLDAMERQRASLTRQFIDAQRALSELNVAVDSAVPSLRTTLAVAPDLISNLNTESTMLTTLGAGVDNNPTLPTLVAGISHGPTSTGGGLETRPDGSKVPIFRICLLGPGYSGCDGSGGFQPPGGNGVPAANFTQTTDGAMFAAMMGA